MDIGKAVAHLRERLPEFAPLHAEFIARWRNWPDGPPGYAAVTCFGQEFLAPLIQPSDSAQAVEVIQRALDAVEDLLLLGDELVADAVYFGVVDFIYLKEKSLAPYRLGALLNHEIVRARGPRS